MPFEQLLQRLKAEVERKGVSRVADACGISAASVSRIIRGEQWPSRSVLEKLLNCVGLAFDISDLPRPFHSSRTVLGLIEGLAFTPSIAEALADVLRRESFVGKYGRQVTGQEPTNTIYALAGTVSEARITATDENGLRELRPGTPQQGESFVKLLMAAVPLKAQRVTAGPVYIPHRSWPPQTPQAEALASVLLGRLLGDVLDMLFVERLPDLPAIESETDTAEAVATAICENGSDRLFRRDENDRPRGLLLASPAKVAAWAAAATGTRSLELAHNRLAGLEVVGFNLPEDFEGLAVVLPRDRLVFRCDDVEVLRDEESAVGYAYYGIRVTARCDCKVLASDDERLSFSVKLRQGGN
jgi:transcriptional regulator with XRE-family HTH domain